MNEQQAAELLKYVKDGVEYGKEQAPILAQEILYRGILLDWCWLVLFLSLLLASVWFIRLCIKKVDEWHDSSVHGGFIAGIGAIGFGIGVIFQVLDLVSIYTAPKIYILENIGRVLR